MNKLKNSKISLPDLSDAGKILANNNRDNPASLECSDRAIFRRKRLTVRSNISPDPFFDDNF